MGIQAQYYFVPTLQRYEVLTYAIINKMIPASLIATKTLGDDTPKTPLIKDVAVTPCTIARDEKSCQILKVNDVPFCEWKDDKCKAKENIAIWTCAEAKDKSTDDNHSPIVCAMIDTVRRTGISTDKGCFYHHDDKTCKTRTSKTYPATNACAAFQDDDCSSLPGASTIHGCESDSDAEDEGGCVWNGSDSDCSEEDGDTENQQAQSCFIKEIHTDKCEIKDKKCHEGAVQNVVMSLVILLMAMLY